jgi:hypothetical protein
MTVRDDGVADLGVPTKISVRLGKRFLRIAFSWVNMSITTVFLVLPL